MKTNKLTEKITSYLESRKIAFFVGEPNKVEIRTTKAIFYIKITAEKTYQLIKCTDLNERVELTAKRIDKLTNYIDTLLLPNAILSKPKVTSNTTIAKEITASTKATPKPEAGKGNKRSYKAVPTEVKEFVSDVKDTLNTIDIKTGMKEFNMIVRDINTKCKSFLKEPLDIDVYENLSNGLKKMNTVNAICGVVSRILQKSTVVDNAEGILSGIIFKR